MGGISVLAIVLSISAPANAIELFGETFDTNTVDLTSTLSTYSNFSYTGNGDAVVQNGQLSLTTTGAGNRNSLFVQIPTTKDIVITGDITKNNPGGTYNAGLIIGGNNLIFHPGFPEGAFRVEGLGGFGNQNMGFTPSAFPTFHAFEVQVTTDGVFDIKVTDGDNPSNIYTASFTNSNYTPGDLIGFTVEGDINTPSNTGVFDNLQIVAVPFEVSPTLGLLTIGSIWGVSRLRKKREVSQ